MEEGKIKIKQGNNKGRSSNLRVNKWKYPRLKNRCKGYRGKRDHPMKVQGSNPKKVKGHAQTCNGYMDIVMSLTDQGGESRMVEAKEGVLLRRWR